MHAKKKSSRNVSKLSRNNNINPIRPKRSKRSKSALQKKKTNRGRRSRRLTRGGRDRGRGEENPCEQWPGELDREGIAKIKKGETCSRNGVTGICRLAESGEPGRGSYNCLEAKRGFLKKMFGIK